MMRAQTMMRRSLPQRQRRATGLGMVEVMITLSISAALLLATAGAVDASFQAYRINGQTSAVMHRTRTALHRLINEVRLAEAHEPYTAHRIPAYIGGTTVADTGVRLLVRGVEHAFYLENPYPSATSPTQLMLDTDGDPATADAVVLRGVTWMSITLEPMRSKEAIRAHGPTADCDLLRRATVHITVVPTPDDYGGKTPVGVGATEFSFTVLPRQNVW